MKITVRNINILIPITLGIILFFHSGFLKGQSDIHGFSKIPLTKSFNTDEYNGGIQNWDITQDQNGYLYVANNFGLLQYDGISWRIFLVLNNTRVRSVFADADGRIYIGGQNQFGYFESDAIGGLKFYSLYDSLPEEDKNLEDIWKIVKHDGNILFSSGQGIVSYDGSSVSKLPQPVDFDLVFKVANRLLAYSPIHGLVEKINNTFIPVPGADFLKETEITAIVPHQNNSLLIFQKEGMVFKYQKNTFKPWELPFSYFLKESLVNKAIILKNNNIAIGTQNNGLLIVSPEGKILNHLTKGKGLNNRTVLSLHEDQFQNLWVGLNNGITMIELSLPFSLVDEQSGLPGTGYAAAYSGNKLYLGTSTGLYYQETRQEPLLEANKYQIVENSNGQVYNIQAVGNTLFLAHHNGAFYINDTKATQFYSTNGTWKFDYLPGTEKIIAGTYEGFITFEKTNDTWRMSDELTSFSESSRVFQFINDSTLFMTHGYLGVFRISLNRERDSIAKVEYFGAKDGFPTDKQINVFNLGGKIVFAAEQGIFTFDESSNTFMNYDQLEKHLGTETHVRVLNADLNGNIYFFSDTELGYLEPTPFGEYEKRSEVFSRIQKYLSDDLENISIIDHENILFGAKEGFIHYNPSVDYVKSQQFETFIRKIVVETNASRIIFNGAGKVPENISLPANMQSLKFHFAAPFFNGQEDLTFQYQLENFEKDWSDWSTLAEKEYTNLSEGNYTFRVRARNVFNNTSNIASVDFQIVPPWYLSRLAYAFYSIGLLFLFLLSMYLQRHRHKKQQQQLTAKQKRELLRKESEIEEVSKKSEAEIARLRNEKLQSEVDHKNRELATNTMHLINKNEFMLSLKDSLAEVAKNGQNPKDSLKKIIKTIDRNLSEDEGWDQFTKHFDQVHGDFLKNLKSEHPTLTPQEIKLCAYLRMNMSSKEIANLLNISVRGVEIGRYRLRKKLELNRDTNLVDFMMEFA